jgi:hypothetical protein
MERHLMRMHEARQRFFSNTTTNRQQARFKAQKFVYHSWPFGLQNSLRDFKWPIPDAFSSEQKNPTWLERLRRMAEVSRLLKELTPTPTSAFSINRLNGLIDNSYRYVPPFKLEDLEITGYTAYICEVCLVTLPLTLYIHGPSLKLVPTFHTCNTERIIEVQQEMPHNKDVFATLAGELPNLMFRTVRIWTKCKPSLRVTEIPSVPQNLHTLKPVDKKKWALRAIRDKFTFLSEGELVDFLNLAGHQTYAFFKMEGHHKTYGMYIATEETKYNFPLGRMDLQPAEQ